jgi:hypothetical protein|tara:strand:+ start:1997 stop:2182 length:186 start_codon:yes stop_codon:yes gene_type:complete
MKDMKDLIYAVLKLAYRKRLSKKHNKPYKEILCSDLDDKDWKHFEDIEKIKYPNYKLGSGK